MKQWPAIAVAFVAMAMPIASAAGGALASPSNGGQCTWVPQAPKVVDVSDTKMVTASIVQGSCTVRGVPSVDTTVCLSIQNEGTGGDCASQSQTDPPQVFYRYVPGATYVMTARGCVDTYEPSNLVCQAFGPSYFTL